MGNLWGPSGFPIPHIGLCGEYNQGKSLFGATIAPEETLIIDLEDSTASFAHTMPIKQRVSLYDSLSRRHQGKMPSDVDAFIWFRDFIQDISPGEFQVCFVDPINDIESGLENLIRTDPDQFGLTKKQVSDAPGLVWGAMNRYWKYWLGVQSAKFESFVFTTHMGNVWDGGKPIKGKRKSKGKSVLKEIASLFIYLKRETDANNVLNKIPTGFVAGDNAKERMAVWHPDTRQMVPILPPRIEQCTPDKIREYIANPVGLREYQQAELLPPEQPMSEEEKLQLQAEIAENTRAAEDAKLMSMQMIAEAAKRNSSQQQQPVVPDKPQQPSEDIDTPAPNHDAVPESSSETDQKQPEQWQQEMDDDMAKKDRSKKIESIKLSLSELGASMPEQIAMLERYGAKTFDELTDENIETILSKIAAIQAGGQKK